MSNYNTAGLLWKYTTGTQDWRYRYSASGEREQKRSYPDVSLTTNSLPLRWTYYLLGADKRQLAVYEGEEMPLHPCEQMALTPPPPTRSVYFLPKEYLTYGGAGVSLISTKLADKEYRILDHLGNVRTVISQNIGIKPGMDYEPFGASLSPTPERLTFIGKEKDKESDLGDFGVRKYDDDIGRFTSIDVLWEKYRGWSPYSYSANNPMRFIDPNGKEIIQGKMTKEQWDKFNIEVIPYLRAMNSETVNSILDKALGKETQIYLNIAEHGDKLESGFDKAKGEKMTKDWGSERGQRVLGMTWAKEKGKSADIVIESSPFDGMFETDDKQINKFAPVILGIIDELNHATSSDKEQLKDHSKLKEKLCDDIHRCLQLKALEGQIESLDWKK